MFLFLKSRTKNSKHTSRNWFISKLIDQQKLRVQYFPECYIELRLY